VRFCAYCGHHDTDLHHCPPRGMGGSKRWIGTLVPLCRQHHEDLHMKRWELVVEDGVAWGWARDGSVLFSRKLEDLEDE